MPLGLTTDNNSQLPVRRSFYRRIKIKDNKFIPKLAPSITPKNLLQLRLRFDEARGPALSLIRDQEVSNPFNCIE